MIAHPTVPTMPMAIRAHTPARRAFVSSAGAYAMKAQSAAKAMKASTTQRFWSRLFRM